MKFTLNSRARRRDKCASTGRNGRGLERANLNFHPVAIDVSVLAIDVVLTVERMRLPCVGDVLEPQPSKSITADVNPLVARRLRAGAEPGEVILVKRFEIESRFAVERVSKAGTFPRMRRHVMQTGSPSKLVSQEVSSQRQSG